MHANHFGLSNCDPGQARTVGSVVAEGKTLSRVRELFWQIANIGEAILKASSLAFSCLQHSLLPVSIYVVTAPPATQSRRIDF